MAASLGHILHRDIETRSTARLDLVGTWRYAANPTTDVLCIGFAVDDGPAETWLPGQPIPEVFFQAANDPCCRMVAHNDAFETAIEQRVLQPRYGWPLIPIEQHICTMALASANALPAALENAATALGLPYQKDREGYRVMRRMAQPRRPHKGEDPSKVYWQDDMMLRAQLVEYNKRDVEIERALYRRLPPLSEEEQKLWVLDALINARGFAIDVVLAQAAQKIVEQEQSAINADIAVLTAGKITSANQVARIAEYVRERGHEVKNLSKRAVSTVLAGDPSNDVRQILELRRAGAQAAVRKLERLLASVDDDHRLRGTLRFHGASTGRWAGRAFQPQNLKKPQTADLDGAIDAILTGDMARVRRLGTPLAVAGDVSRSMIRAAPGHRLIGGDFSSIESRVLAWLAGEDWKLDTYRQFDISNDPALEPYCVTASRILKRSVTLENEADRQIGKTCDLAFGYGGGLGAWRRFDGSNIYDDDAVNRFKAEWRSAHKATARFWRALEAGVHRAVRSGQRVTLRNLIFEYHNRTLYLTLPSGRRLVYPEAQVVPGKFDGSANIIFKDNARGGWSEARAWYGTFTENVVQAVARDQLAAAMLRLEGAGYPVVLHVHDEIVCEVPDGFGSTEEFLRLMTELRDWAAGLPIAAKTWTGLRYAKTKAPTIISAEPAPTPTPSPSSPSPRSSPTPIVAVPVMNLVCNPHNGTDLHAVNGIEVVDARPAIDTITLPTLAEQEDGRREQLELGWEQIPLADLIGRPLSNGKISCPFHDGDETPSLHIYPDHFHCFGCGAHGDHLDWLRDVEGLDEVAAIKLLADWQGPLSLAPKADNGADRTLASALRLWEEARPITNTPALCYLREVRGINVEVLPDQLDAVLRYHPRCPFDGANLPCLLALYRDVESDAPAGIHRIALTHEVFAGGKVKRLTLGSWPRPRAIKLWPAAEQLFVGEGLETTLAAATRISHRGAPMRPAWAAGSSGNMGKLPVLAGVEQLVLLVDHDHNGQGQAAAARCAYRWSQAGRRIIRLKPKRLGADFNDIVMERAS